MWFQGRGLELSFQNLIDVSWHGNIDVLQMIILFQGEYTVKYASYVAYCYVFCLKFVVQMDNVGMCRVLDSEIIDNEGE